MEHREQERLQRLSSQQFRLPQTYIESMTRYEQRREQWSKVQDMKREKIIKKQEVNECPPPSLSLPLTRTLFLTQIHTHTHTLSLTRTRSLLLVFSKSVLREKGY